MDRFKSEYFNAPAMRIGLVQFGNSRVNGDGTVTPATVLSEMTSDVETLKESLDEMTLQQGMTDMTGVFAAAQRMLTGRGPKWLIVITDGKPTALVAQAARKARKLEER